MTPEEVAEVRASLADVRAAGACAAEAFYAELFRRDPSARALFHRPAAEQAAVFLHELDALLSAVSDLPGFVDRAGRLGRRHAGLGVRAEHFAAAGAALTGGAVAPWARGRGAYRALVAARWDDAVARGTPVLVTQAGPMSRPILGRLGFREVCEIRILVDRFAA